LADLAAGMDIKVNAVKQLLHCARQSVRDCIRERLR
jgi:DNA-directed RNA polymerase specialized sigma24 family protein